MEKQPRKSRPLQAAETSWAVDPLSDLVSASELAAWRKDLTTQKIVRFLARWRGRLLEHIGDGGTTADTAEQTAILTTEAVTQAQTLNDIIRLEAKDVAFFYNLEEPDDKPSEAKH